MITFRKWHHTIFLPSLTVISIYTNLLCQQSVNWHRSFPIGCAPFPWICSLCAAHMTRARFTHLAASRKLLSRVSFDKDRVLKTDQSSAFQFGCFTTFRHIFRALLCKDRNEKLPQTAEFYLWAMAAQHCSKKASDGWTRDHCRVSSLHTAICQTG